MSGKATAHAGKLEAARSLLRRVERPFTSLPSDAQLLPVAAPLRELLPAGRLRRGSTVAVRGSTSLLLALLTEASAAGSWSAVVGRPDLGLVAADEAGVNLARLALVPSPGAELVGVVAALLDGVDLVAVAGVERLRAGDRQRLAARARGRGSVLLPLGRWPGADLELRCDSASWQGLGPNVGATGVGRLRSRTLLVGVHGRGVAPAPPVEVSLDDGVCSPAASPAASPVAGPVASPVRAAG